MKNCGNCNYANYSEEDGYVCANMDSEYATDFVEHDHVCDEHEEKEGV